MNSPPEYGFSTAAPVAVQLGANMVNSTIGKYLPFASAMWHSLRYYFDVNNAYVKNKLQVLLAPYRHKSWKRLPAEESGGAYHDPNTVVRVLGMPCACPLREPFWMSRRAAPWHLPFTTSTRLTCTYQRCLSSHLCSSLDC